MEIRAEMNRGIQARRSLLALCLLIGCALAGFSQPSGKLYTIKDGKMHIELSKQLNETSLDSFISQYALQNLALKQFLKDGFEDSIKNAGWEIKVNNRLHCVINKPLLAFEYVNDPVERIEFVHSMASIDARFPSVSNKVSFGHNQFKNKSSFKIRDSAVIFYLRNYQQASRVMLAGSFNNWLPDALPMTKTDSGWVVQLILTPGKYWYKFIVDGQWMNDSDNQHYENDGLGNTNSVFFFSNMNFRLNGFSNARRVYLAGSFNKWQEKQLLMNKTATGWELPLYLAEGTHTYRFIVDGDWMVDPSNPDRLPNEFNDFNSVVRIGKPHIFHLEGFPNAREVVLAGSFNSWRTDELFMKKVDNGWEISYTLGPGNYEFGFRVDGFWVSDTGKQIIANKPAKKAISTSSFVIDPNYTFRLKGFADAKSVFLAGDFNDWSRTSMPMKKEGDEWVFRPHLSTGKHLYKFIVDGKWIIDPTNKLWEQNRFDTGNSVLWKEKTP